eukprot:CAMPEP_0115757670 /NCGR_PEP_ID=MMETSP0272-20121206/98545_1 /TAXON_ID=71861 /ORGANISM="Scrippsiella trochoidea, Strain CCMP3099" /LENGTH=60 /DNA_ID=CAMNT_0003203195 /DNA_START=574 /DNA_END=756 /DNA_ORIENTATION=-
MACPTAASFPSSGTFVFTTAKGAISKLEMPRYFVKIVPAILSKFASKKVPPSTSTIAARA